MAYISFCAIVRDEKDAVVPCLESVSKIADELIVVDTGSVDGTPELCREQGADVYQFAWADDFAAARNYGLSKATGQWILWLDADELLRITDQDGVMKVLRETTSPLVGLNMCHYTGARPHDIKRSFTSLGYRFFRRDSGIHFDGRIHEHLQLPPDMDTPIDAPVIPCAWIEHFGYLDEVVESRGKGRRNLTLLLRECEENPDPWIFYHIAAEYYRAKDIDSAYSQINTALAKFLEQGRKPPAEAYKLKYDILLNCCGPEELPGVLAGLERTLALYPDYVDLFFYRGILLWEMERYWDAAEVFSHCLALGDGSSHLSLTGTGSFYAEYYLDLCQKICGRDGPVSQ